MKLLKTFNNEEAARLLCQRYKHVMVKPSNFISRPIRFRSNLISDLPVYMYKEWDTAYAGQFKQWEEGGGILLDYPWANRHKWPNGRLIPHNAHLHVECPTSMYWIDKDTLGCKDVRVVFRPPTWQWHDMEVDLRYPHPDILTRVFESLHTMSRREMSSRNAAACKSLGLETTGIAAVTDAELANSAQIIDEKLVAIRKRMEEEGIERHILQVVCVTPRIEPEDFTLRQFYRRIVDMPDMHRGERMLDPRKMRKVDGHWKKLIKRLVRDGNLQKSNSIYIYPVIHYKPDWQLANKQREDAYARMAEIKGIVDGAEELE